MMQLHLIQQKLSFKEFTDQFSRFASAGDQILFLNDSLYCLIEDQFNSRDFSRLSSEVNIFIIKEQAEARNICDFPEDIKQIDYSNFVDMSLKANKVVSW